MMSNMQYCFLGEEYEQKEQEENVQVQSDECAVAVVDAPYILKSIYPQFKEFKLFGFVIAHFF